MLLSSWDQRLCLTSCFLPIVGPNLVNAYLLNKFLIGSMNWSEIANANGTPSSGSVKDYQPARLQRADVCGVDAEQISQAVTWWSSNMIAWHYHLIVLRKELMTFSMWILQATSSSSAELALRGNLTRTSRTKKSSQRECLVSFDVPSEKLTSP